MVGLRLKKKPDVLLSFYAFLSSNTVLPLSGVPIPQIDIKTYTETVHIPIEYLGTEDTLVTFTSRSISS